MIEAIHIHEDDWGMRNLFPVIARDEAEKDMAASVAAEKRNRDSCGVGYTDVHMISTPSIDYSHFGLRLSDTARVLTPFFPRIRRFNATVFSAIGSDKKDPFGSYDEDAWCFGLGASCYLKLDANGPFVSNIWFDLNTDEAIASNRLRSAIESIDALVPSMIADYSLDFTGVISEPGTLDRYLAKLREQHGVL